LSLPNKVGLSACVTEVPSHAVRQTDTQQFSVHPFSTVVPKQYT